MSIPRDDRLKRIARSAAREDVAARSIREEKQVEGGAVATHALGEHTGNPADIGAAEQDHDHPPQDNFSAAAAPAVTDDERAGYSNGSIWVYTTTGQAWVCVDPTEGAAVWDDITAGAAGAQSVPLLDGSEHTDTVAQAPTKGSLIVGDATPKWNELIVGADGLVLTAQADGTVAWEAAGGGGDVATDTIWDAAGDLAVGTGADTAARLAIGAAHSIPQTLDGATITWETAPEIQYIKAPDGTTRITTVNDVSWGGIRLDGAVSIGTAVSRSNQLYVVMTGALGQYATTMNGINIISSAYSIINSNKTVTVFKGSPSVSFATDAATGLVLDGMNFEPQASLGAGVSASFTRVSGLSAMPNIGAPFGETITVALVAGLYLPDPTGFGGLGTAVVTDCAGVYIESYGDPSATNCYGIKIFDQTGGATASYGIYIEDADTYSLWVDAGLSRFDGDGTDVFELPADATANGAAQVGRIPVKIGGGTQYLYYYGS